MDKNAAYGKWFGNINTIAMIKTVSLPCSNVLGCILGGAVRKLSLPRRQGTDVMEADRKLIAGQYLHHHQNSLSILFSLVSVFRRPQIFLLRFISTPGRSASAMSHSA